MGRLFNRSPDDNPLEREMARLRPQPQREFVDALLNDVEGRKPGRRLGRVGVALALTGLMLVAFASFGGVGYASSAAAKAIKKVETVVRSNQPAAQATSGTSASAAQYGPFTPPTPKPKPTPKPPPPSGGTQGALTPPATPPASQGLPFTGLALWIPVVLGLAVFLLGLGLRRIARRGQAL
jgi:hypothetical protein